MNNFSDNTALEILVTVSPESCSFGNLRISQLMLLHQMIGEKHINIFGTGSEKMRKEQNLAFIFTKAAINIHRLPKENETILLRTWCSELKGVRFTRNYQTFDLDGNVLTESKCEVTTIDLETRRIVRPSSINDFNDFLYNNQLENGCDSPKKVVIPEILNFSLNRKAEKEDIDFNGHINNTVYADIMVSALPEKVRNLPPKKVYINFVNEVLQNEIINVFCNQFDSTFAVVGKVNEKVAFCGEFLF